MMRYIFLFLILINIGYLFYHLNSDSKETLEKKVLSEKSIVLYLESTADHQLPKIKPTDDIRASDVIVEGNTGLTEQLKEPKDFDIQLDDTSNDKAIEELFTKVESQSKSIINNERQLSHSTQNIKTTVNCLIIGPTLHKKKLGKIKNDIAKQYNNIDFMPFEQKGITFYRIFIPPLNSKPEIKKAQQTLSENNLRDHYVMNSDGRKNAIALGVFRVKQIAENIAEEVKNLGYPAVVESIFEPNKVQFFLKIRTSDKQKNLDLNKEKLKTDLEIKLCKKN